MYAGRSALFQLFLLLLFAVAGAIVFSFIASLSFYAIYGSFDLAGSAGAMRWLQFMSATGIFLLPALAIAWFCSPNPKEYLSIKPWPKAEIWMLTLVSMLLLSPAISLTGSLNQEMSLPEWMAPLEEWMRRQENLARQATEIFLQNSSYLNLFLNLIVIAVMAGITEEFFFRGALQRILAQWTPNHHTVIWVTAILFSTFHLQFFGFIPRLLLGAYFGYLLYWGRNIWIPVFAHFTNNAFAVIGMSDNEWKENEFISGEIPADHLWQFTLIAALTFILFILLVRRLRGVLQASQPSA